MNETKTNDVETTTIINVTDGNIAASELWYHIVINHVKLNMNERKFDSPNESV